LPVFKAQIIGRVQGVGYRFFTEDVAIRLNIKGYVKNLYDGSVEVYAEADKEILEHFLEALKRGPGLARVGQVKVEWLDKNPEHHTFRIAY
jgi:acylphosphatase